MGTSKFNILVIGEVLVDIFPEYKRIGGAPFNFAFHLNAFNYNVNFISRIGEDQLGTDILNFMSDNHLSAKYIQIDKDHPTGRVLVKLAEGGIPDFTIMEDVAFDFIEYDKEIEKIKKDIHLIYIGTLVQRDKRSLSTLMKVLDTKNKESLVFYDINIRQKFYSKEIIDNSLKQADIIKLNGGEVGILKKIYDSSYSDRDFLKMLSDKFHIKWLSLTRGEKGSILIHNGKCRQASPNLAYLKIKDTVGAGDAYSSILSIGILNNWPMEKILNKATEYSAAICGIEGAVPEGKTFLNRFKRWA